MRLYIKTAKEFFVLIIIPFILLISCKGNDSGITYPAPEAADHYILANGRIVSESTCGMGVDDSRHLRNWVFNDSASIRMDYPGGNLNWGAVFFTINGNPSDRPHPSSDYSKFSKIELEMRSKSDSEYIKLGLKDADDLDDGTETRLPVQLSSKWKYYSFNLSGFSSCNLKRLYVVTEFVFPGSLENKSQSIYVRTIHFSK